MTIDNAHATTRFNLKLVGGDTGMKEVEHRSFLQSRYIHLVWKE
jgi:hypothetical protein